MEILEGTIVGRCSKHGIVLGDALENNFPNQSNCAVCGRKLETVKAVTSDIEVADHKVTGEV